MSNKGGKLVDSSTPLALTILAEHMVEVGGGDLESAETVVDVLSDTDEKWKERRARERISHPTIDPERGY